MQDMWVQSPGGEDHPLEKEMATHSSVLAWEIRGQRRSLTDYSPRGCKESGITEQPSRTSKRRPSLVAQMVRSPPANSGNVGSITGSGRSREEVNGNPL